MYNRKHEVIYRWNNIVITAHMTQTELAKLIMTPGIHLESVNAPKKVLTQYKHRSNKSKKIAVIILFSTIKGCF